MQGIIFNPDHDRSAEIDLRLNKDNGLIFGKFRSKCPGGVEEHEVWIQFSSEDAQFLSIVFERLAISNRAGR